jgi:hypothetical protein
MIGLFYVQDGRYVTDAGKRWSDDVQDGRYVTDAGKRWSDDVQDERYVTDSGKRWSDDVQDLGAPCGVLTAQDRNNN